ncbi:MAG: hypothetical protein Q9202_006947 [Teloschistes flavicans]
MVIIQPCADPPLELNGYATSPLTLEMNQTVQHAIYNGSHARYNDTRFKLEMHDRPEFHGISHYDMRVALDAEGMMKPFVIVDENTLDLNAVWYVEDTEDCKHDSTTAQFPPVTYPGEDFTLWQALMTTGDVPTLSVCWYVYGCDCGTLIEAVEPYNRSYDPHDPHPRLVSNFVDWTDPETQANEWGYALVMANGTEVEWSTHHQDHGGTTFVVRLRDEVATGAGLLPYWTPKQRISPPNEEVQLLAPYDWNSPIWPRGYPDDSPSHGVPLSLPQARQPVINRNATNPLTDWAISQKARQGTCNRLQRGRPKPKIPTMHASGSCYNHLTTA